MDRSNVAVAAPAIQAELGLSSLQLGFIFSAFGWSYALLQIPGGMLVDRFGPRIVYSFTLICWSVTTLLQAFIKGFYSLSGLRMLTGAFEAPAFPTNNRIVTEWFPHQERATAIGIYTSGQFIGLAFLTPMLTALLYAVGWRGMFLITGIIGIVWGVLWYYLYRSPKLHAAVNKLELNYIRRGGGIADEGTDSSSKGKSLNWVDFKAVMGKRKLWGIYIGQFSVNATLWFFLTWFPSYLINFRGLNTLASGFWAAAPFMAAFVGVLCSGFFSDLLIRKGFALGLARKTPIVVGLLLSTLILGANFVESPPLIILFLALGFFGNGLASITWVFVSILAPKALIGLTGGVFNFIGGLASIIVPLVIGYLVKDGDFKPALIFIATTALIGALSYIFLVGRIAPTLQPTQK